LNKIIAIACSTGGPKALQQLVPQLNDRLHCPVVIVQHMPNGFTKSLAERLDLICSLPVCEAEDNMIIENNKVYIAKAGYHLKIAPARNCHRIVFSEEPNRNGVRPCANYMYESLAQCNYDEIICVVLTGMGCDGTEGIEYLSQKKPIQVLVQDKESAVVYGMPGSILKSKVKTKICNLSELGNEMIKLSEG